MKRIKKEPSEIKELGSLSISPSPNKGGGEKVKHSRNLISVKLQYNNQADGTQLSIFDVLTPITQEKIIKTGSEVEFKNRKGAKVNLTKGEYKVIDCLAELLHEKSQHINPKAQGYYSGNEPAELVIYGGKTQTGGDRKAYAPKLSVSLYDLTKKYKGGEYVAGSEIKEISRLLTGLADDPAKKVLIRYSRVTAKTDGGMITDTIEEYDNLIKILKITRVETSKNNQNTSQKEDTIIQLNPVFREQIGNKFVLFPKDIVRRMIEATGTHNIPESTYKLRDYLARELSYQNYNPEIGLNKLYWMLADEYMKQSRKKLVKQFTDRAIEAVIKLGLLTKLET